MKTLTKNIIFIISLVFFLSVANSSSAQVSKTVMSMFSVGDAVEIELSISAEDVELRKTKGSRVLVETTITVNEIPNLQLLEFIIEGGRYDLTLEKNYGKVTISPPKWKNVLMVKGEEVSEKVSYVVFLPATIEIVKANGSVVQ